MKFNARLSGRSLSAGKYQLTLVATDAAKNRSKAATVSFSVQR